MRLRKKPWAENELLTNSRVVKNAKEHKGCWRGLFERELENNTEALPLYVEIGAGKGKFLLEMSEKNRDALFLGIEKNENALAIAARRVKAAQTADNLLLINEDAFYINELFEEKEISGLYINFCDPWHKKRHAKRRLTHSEYLKKYEKLLGINASLTLKTDNEDLYLFSADELLKNGWRILSQTEDLHGVKNDVKHGVKNGVNAGFANCAAKGLNSENIDREAAPARDFAFFNSRGLKKLNCCMTDYEERFFSLGTRVFQITAAPYGYAEASGSLSGHSGQQVTARS